MNMTNRAGTSARELLPGEKLILPGTTVGGESGTFYVDLVLWNQDRTLSRSLKGLVDTKVSNTLVPASILEQLGIERERSRMFTLTDGSKQELSEGWAVLEMEGQFGAIGVIFYAESSEILIGAMALSAFGLAADASAGRLIPGELTL